MVVATPARLLEPGVFIVAGERKCTDDERVHGRKLGSLGLAHVSTYMVEVHENLALLAHVGIRTLPSEYANGYILHAKYTRQKIVRKEKPTILLDSRKKI